MSLDADLLLDRVRLKRRLVWWRVGAIVLLVGVLLLSARIGVGGHGTLSGPHLVRLRVDGVIAEDRKRLDEIDRATDDGSVKGMILAIDSPGGSVSGGESLHDAIARFAAKKPVVVTMGGVAASAGYMIAVPAARIYASNATLTGSIGVILQSPDLSGLLGKIGVSVDELVSGPLKGQPSVVKPLSPEGRAMLQGVVTDLFDQFVAMVATGRHMDEARVRALADGRPYTGHQALGLGLIDAIGGEREARQWLAKNRSIPEDMRVEPLQPRHKRGWLRGRISGLARGLGADAMSGALDTLPSGVSTKVLSAQGVALDGAVSLWQP